MKLQTSIKPRRDGTVRVVGLNGETYVFQRDNEGEMSADVPHDGTVAHLLEGGLFWPADEQDHGRALSLAAEAAPAPAPKTTAKPGSKAKPAPSPAPTHAKPE